MVDMLLLLYQLMDYMVLALGIALVLGSIPELMGRRTRCRLLSQKGYYLSCRNLIADLIHLIFGIFIILSWFTLFRLFDFGLKIFIIIFIFTFIQLFYWKYSTVSLLIGKREEIEETERPSKEVNKQ